MRRTGDDGNMPRVDDAADLADWVPEGLQIVDASVEEIRTALARHVHDTYGGEVSLDEFLAEYRAGNGLERSPAFRFLAHTADLIADDVT